MTFNASVTKAVKTRQLKAASTHFLKFARHKAQSIVLLSSS